MARRTASLARSFRNDFQLKQYYLNGVVPTEKTLGVGSYGSVVEVEYQQVSCAAKRMHEILLDPGNQGIPEIIQKYQQECQLMASLRHPNITQFLGLCFIEGSELPLLVMEKLEMSVDDLLECAPNIPLPIKISILTDTSSRLVYLHSRTPPIVHRDLTARNVLLTASLTAKITDMGNSRIVNVTPDQLAQTMSKNPGTTVYMPPEALNDSHKYGPSLDIFSFGHLALYILTQMFPGDLLSATQVDPHNPGEVVGRSEVKRREVYMKKLENQLLESNPILVELVTNCLQNNFQTRPSAEQLIRRLQLVKNNIIKIYGGNLGKAINTANVLQMKEIKLKDKRIHDLEVCEIGLEAEITELTKTITRLEIEIKNLESAKTQITNEKSQVIFNSNQLEADIFRVKVENTQLKSEKSLLNTENAHLKAKNEELLATKSQLERDKIKLESHFQHEKHSLQMEVKRLTRELQGTISFPDDKKFVEPIFKVSETKLEKKNAKLTKTNTRLYDKKGSLKSSTTQHTCEKKEVAVKTSQQEADISTMEAENTRLRTEYNQHQQKTEESHLKSENAQLKTDNDKLYFTMSQREREKVQLESHYQQEKYSLQMEVERLTRELQRSTTGLDDKKSVKPISIAFPLKIDWKCGPDMPAAMSTYIQSVEFNGRVYVGGGYTDRIEDGYIVMAYSILSFQWHSLPICTTKGFAMAIVNSKLVLVGGRARDNSDSNELQVWQANSSQWTHPFPPMSTPRYRSSATLYKYWLVVAGGHHEDGLHSIEVLDVSNMQWSTRPSTPTPWMGMKCITLGNTWYFMGGYCDGLGWSPDAYSVSLEALVSQSASDSSNIWRKLPSLDCTQSCPLIIEGSLLAVSGRNVKIEKPVSTIQRYVPETKTWIQAGQLPHAVCQCTCIMTSDKLHIIGGYNGKTFLKNIFYSATL